MLAKNNIYLSLLALVLVFSACEPEEDPVEPVNIESMAAEMGDSYGQQLYFDLASGTFVAANNRAVWDLAFECDAAGSQVLLNSANLMFAWNTRNTDFASVSDTLGAEWLYDNPSGRFDETAIGNWLDNDGNSLEQVYIIDRGLDATGTPLGFMKLQLLSVDANSYRIRYAALDGSGEQTHNITKNTNKTFVQFSLNTHTLLEIEPDKDQWDLLFTQYTDIQVTVDNDSIPYLVRGVLSNRNGVAVAMEPEKTFESLHFDDLGTYTFSEALNGIGYDWKIYSFDSNRYEVFSNFNYLIKDTEGFYFKLHFIDYYNPANGEKGYAIFRYEGL